MLLFGKLNDYSVLNFVVKAAVETVVQGSSAVDTDGEASRSSSVGPQDDVDRTTITSASGVSDSALSCPDCGGSAAFRDKLALKEHLETVHPRESHRCTVAGCDKLFTTRKSRNRHSQNDNLHRHLSVIPVAPPPRP